MLADGRYSCVDDRTSSLPVARCVASVSVVTRPKSCVVFATQGTKYEPQGQVVVHAAHVSFESSSRFSEKDDKVIKYQVTFEMRV